MSQLVGRVASGNINRLSFGSIGVKPARRSIRALATNEDLPAVLIEFTTVSAKGIEQVDHSSSLTNATISSLREFTEPAQSANEIDDLEEISFTFQKIEIKDKSGKSFADDWEART